MRQLTDLFCLTILFAKFSMLASFILHVLAFGQIYWGTVLYGGLMIRSW